MNSWLVSLFALAGIGLLVVLFQRFSGKLGGKVSI